MPPLLTHVKKCSYSLEFEKVRQKLRLLRDESILTDVHLICNGTKIMAHRCILSVNSPYFRELFCLGGDETEQKLPVVIDVTEHSPNALQIKTFVDFMYTGSIVITEYNVIELLNLSIIYICNDLSELCSKFIKKYVTHTNCISMYLNLSYLQSCAVLETCREEMGMLLSYVYSVVVANINNIYFNLKDFGTLTTGDVKHLLAGGIGKCIHVHTAVKFAAEWLCDHLTDLGVEACLEFLAVAERQAQLLEHDEDDVEKTVTTHRDQLNSMLWGSGISSQLQHQIHRKVRNIISLIRNEDIEEDEPPNIKLPDTAELMANDAVSAMGSHAVSPVGNDVKSPLANDAVSTMDNENESLMENNAISTMENNATLTMENNAISTNDATSPMENEAASAMTTASADYSDSDNVVDFGCSTGDLDLDSWQMDVKTALPASHTSSSSLLTQGKQRQQTQSELENQSPSRRNKRQLKSEAPPSHKKSKVLTTIIERKSKVLTTDVDSKPKDVTTTVGRQPKDVVTDPVKRENRCKSSKETGDEDFCCEICKKRFKRHWHLNRHVASKHTKEQVHMCIVCDRRFSRKEHVRRHMNRVHSSDSPYKCSQCPATIDTVKAIVNHMHQHYNPSPGKAVMKTQTEPPENGRWVTSEAGTPMIACLLCDKVFEKRDNWKQHQRRKHSTERPFHCDTCGRGFAIKTDYNNHMMRHSGQRPYACDNCGKTFFNKSYQKLHYKFCSGQADVKKHTCEYCGQSFAKVCNLNRHLLNHSDDKPYSCSKCNMTFKHPTNLKMHMKIHTVQIRRFICKVCDRGFYNNRCLKRHMLIHEGVRPYVCNYCSRSFTQNATLTIHLRKHEDPSTYQCEECSKKFHTKSKLSEHYNVVHLGARPFKCKMCPDDFGYKHELVHHILAHNTENDA